MNMADRLGHGPKRDAQRQLDGTWYVTVTAPRYMDLLPQTVILSADQYSRYCDWRNGAGLIQELLGDLSLDQREVLMTGIGAADFARMFGGDDE
jgi:hypothetical protein